MRNIGFRADREAWKSFLVESARAHALISAGVHWSGLAAIFGIGLFFGFVCHRSGNLWIPAVLHGL